MVFVARTSASFVESIERWSGLRDVGDLMLRSDENRPKYIQMNQACPGDKALRPSTIETRSSSNTLGLSSADHQRGAKTHCRWAVCQPCERGGASLRLHVSPSNGASMVSSNSWHASETLPLLMPSRTMCLFPSRESIGAWVPDPCCLLLETLILPN